ncbi:hypothetical protein PENSOL_c077G04304 [Penicillium solitum]|uniref:Uncharacterized protein n=1 Tax=Penicillium solitum TaxID=60172 RepID=A0A1V6QE02_9EURO|nr:uncharacterized protein PENSOL_c077G04304 [Penicillium solitum]OQD87429.1 hypothetical protein PENSOL_c077G04304 [Penicillium solitum]
MKAGSSSHDWGSAAAYKKFWGETLGLPPATASKPGSPIRPVTISGISQLHQTLVSFFKGTHISKVVVSFRKHNSLMRIGSAAPTVTFHWWAQRVGAPGAQVLVSVLTKHCVYLSRQACKLGSREQVLCAGGRDGLVAEVHGLSLAVQGAYTAEMGLRSAAVPLVQ